MINRFSEKWAIEWYKLFLKNSSFQAVNFVQKMPFPFVYKRWLRDGWSLFSLDRALRPFDFPSILLNAFTIKPWIVDLSLRRSSSRTIPSCKCPEFIQISRNTEMRILWLAGRDQSEQHWSYRWLCFITFNNFISTEDWCRPWPKCATWIASSGSTCTASICIRFWWVVGTFVSKF